MIIFSGIQPTGRKHLGNYIGGILQYVEGQDRADPSIYCIVDLHAITVEYDPATLRERVYDTAAILMAAGLDPERCILFRQGDVPEHTELTWLLTSVTAIGELNRMHQFRDKSVAQRQLVSAGLLMYPVLQAADVLAYRAHEVPVGEDQREHLELMRDVARRFNERFGELLVVPEHRIPTVGARVRDLQEPERKMSTTGGTEQGTVYVVDEPDVIRRKFKRAVTDSGSEVVRAPDKPGISNLIEILAIARGVTPEAVERDFAGRGYGDFKAAVGDEIADWIAPVRERYADLRADEDVLEDMLAAGAAEAGVGEHALEQLLRRLGRRELAELLDLLPGQHQARLQLQQRRDQHEELGRGLEVQLVARLQVVEVREHDVGELDLQQVQLVAQDQGQQQVERPGEHVEVELQPGDDRGGHELCRLEAHAADQRRLGRRAGPTPIASRTSATVPDEIALAFSAPACRMSSSAPSSARRSA
jgi:tryptophanyl-tRNA synthetase